MVISFNKLAAGGGTTVGLGLAAGVTLLILGLIGGHKWQVIAGNSLLFAGTIGATILFINLHLPRDPNKIEEVLRKSNKTGIYVVTTNDEGKKLYPALSSKGFYSLHVSLQSLDDGSKRVVIPLFC